MGFVAGEMKNLAKLLPRAIVAGLSLVTVIYLLVNVALLHVLSADRVVELGENAAGTAATLLFGDMEGKLISIGIPRVSYAMAEREQLPAFRLLSRYMIHSARRYMLQLCK